MARNTLCGDASSSMVTRAEPSGRRRSCCTSSTAWMRTPISARYSREPYVRRNCSRGEIEEILSNPELVHACRERMERAFRSGELDPGRRRRTLEGS